MFLTKEYSDIGLRRAVNEDSLVVNSSISLFLVSDGMGGYEKGEIASKIVVDSFNSVMQDFCDDSEKTEDIAKDSQTIKKQLSFYLNMALKKSQERIEDYATKNKIIGKIGATVAGVYKDNLLDEIAIFHLGDSRVYRIRDEEIEQLTIDHSLVEEMRRSGKYSNEELAKVGKNILSKAIGNFGSYELEINFFDIKIDDIFVLCSDGVSNFIDDRLLCRYAKDFKIERIRDEIYKNGALDNFTLILCRYC